MAACVVCATLPAHPWHAVPNTYDRNRRLRNGGLSKPPQKQENRGFSHPTPGSELPYPPLDDKTGVHF